MDKKVLSYRKIHSRGWHVLVATISLLLGGGIYIYLRAPEFVFFGWIRNAGFGDLLESARNHGATGSHLLPDWIVFSLPSGLWAFAYTVIIATIWSGNRSRIRFVWWATIPLLVFGYEFLQHLAILPGTFSPVDLAMGMAGILLGILITTTHFKTQSHENAIEE